MASQRNTMKFRLTEPGTLTSDPWSPMTATAATLTFKVSAGTPTLTIKVSNDPTAAIGDAMTLASGVAITAPYALISTGAKYAKYWFTAVTMTGGATLDIHICATLPS